MRTPYGNEKKAVNCKRIKYISAPEAYMDGFDIKIIVVTAKPKLAYVVVFVKFRTRSNHSTSICY